MRQVAGLWGDSHICSLILLVPIGVTMYPLMCMYDHLMMYGSVYTQIISEVLRVHCSSTCLSTKASVIILWHF